MSTRPDSPHQAGDWPGDGGSWTDWANRAERAARGYSPGRGGKRPDGDIRASDAERAAVADQLSTHFAAGRLDQGEFDDRLARVMAAKTRGELPDVLADLPPLHTELADTKSKRAPKQRGGGPPLLAFVLFAVLIVAVIGTLSAVIHAFFWFPLWIPIVIIAVLYFRTGHRHRRHHHDWY